MTGQLCADIKINYPNSKIVFIANKPFVEAAKGIVGVDEVFAFDKQKEHKGLIGLLKFIFKFEYLNKIDTAITIYGNARGVLLSLLLGAKQRISGDIGLLNVFLTHIAKDKCFTHMSDANAYMLEVLTDIPSCQKESVYEPSKEGKNYIKTMLEMTNYNNLDLIGLAPLSKCSKKDWTSQKAAEFINLVNNSGKKVVITGTADAKWFVDELYQLGVNDFLDMTGKTSIDQLGALVERCKSFVSVDTGAMHLACAVQTPTLCLFFNQDMIAKWAPRDVDKHFVVYTPDKISGQEAYSNLEKLFKRISTTVS